jgi:hypothetical protein
MVENGKAIKHQLRLGQAQGTAVEVLQKRKLAAKSPWLAIDGSESVVVAYQGPIEDGKEVAVK